MTISLVDLKLLLQKSGNRCAFPDCQELLTLDENKLDDPVVISQIAHIVAQSEDGPRGKYPLPLTERDEESNLILLCAKHHKVVDGMPQMFTVERLRQIKEDHEALILAATGAAVARRTKDASVRPANINDTLYSTIFPVTTFPDLIFGAPCKYGDGQKEAIRKKIVVPSDPTEMYPYVIQGGELYAVQDLRRNDGPFQRIVSCAHAKPIPVAQWYDDPVKSRWLMTLLNRSLNKLTGRKGLKWDKDHERYYFDPDELGKPKVITFRPLNVSSSSRFVVWQPISKRTGQPRPYWLHRAVGLRFHRVNDAQWCLSMRPEFRVTKDGAFSEEPKRIGSRVTRKKSRMFNYDLLAEVNLWRDFLGEGQPRIILNFGSGRVIIVSTTMMQANIAWPGIPTRYAKPFKNIEYQENLFSQAALERAQSVDEYDVDELEPQDSEEYWLEEEDDE